MRQDLPQRMMRPSGGKQGVPIERGGIDTEHHDRSAKEEPQKSRRRREPGPTASSSDHPLDHDDLRQGKR